MQPAIDRKTKPLGALLSRVAAFVDEHAGQRLTVVTHGGVISALQALAAGSADDPARWPAPCTAGNFVRIAFDSVLRNASHA